MFNQNSKFCILLIVRGKSRENKKTEGVQDEVGKK
jgi:hypothetical protein